MTKYSVAFIMLLCASSCLKIEDSNLCKNAPPAPSLSATNYQVPLGGTLAASVVSPDASLTYSWISPRGYSYNGSSLSYSNVYYTDYGTWGLIAQKAALCASDTTKFTVTQQVGNCGVGRDTFQISGSSFKIVSEYNSTDSYYGYYKMNFTCLNGQTITVTFPSKPTLSANYYIINYNSSYMYSDDCIIAFTSGYFYSSLSGTASVTVSGTTITIKFCSASFINNGTYATAYANGYMIGS